MSFVMLLNSVSHLILRNKNPTTVHSQTVCTRLPLSLLTQEPGIKANDLYHSACRHLYKKISISWLWRCKCYQSLQANFYNIHATPTQACFPRMESLKNYVYMYHNICNSHGLVLTFMPTYEFWCISTLACKSLLNTLRRAVEQLAGCLAKQSKSQQSRSKYNSMQRNHEGLNVLWTFNKMT